MRKIFQGLGFAILLTTIIGEVIIMSIIWKNLNGGGMSERIESGIISIISTQEEERRVVVNKLPVYDSSNVAVNAQGNVLETLHKGDTIILLEAGIYYSKVRTQSGAEGYVWFDCIERLTDDEFRHRKEYVIVLDAGHQSVQNSEEEPVGPGEVKTKPKVSSGTQGVSTGQPEYRLNLDIALMVENILEAQGYTVVMIRKSADVNISNVERAMIANQISADVFVRIHADGSENPETNGAMTIISTEKNKYEVVNSYKESKRLATELLDAYTEYTGINRNRIMESDDYSGINWCTVPVTILEMGYMTNAEEDVKMQDSEMKKKMAEGISEGIINYLEYAYTE